jgi:hypothetical protein
MRKQREISQMPNNAERERLQDAYDKLMDQQQQAIPAGSGA